MRRRVQLRSVPENNKATDLWMQHLIARIVIEQLELPYRLQAKLLYETLPKTKYK
jgi:hypothetical protein